MHNPSMHLVMRRTNRWGASNLIFVSLLLGSQTAYAQDEAGIAASDAAASGNSAGLTEIVVTARKATEKLQDAPIAITAIGGESLTTGGIKDPTDLQVRLPSVSFQSSHVPSILIRGIGTYNNQFNVDSAVAYSYDGTYIAHLYGLPPIMLDIAQVEAVRGPQGTLYGRNANGGGISFVTNRPQHYLDASAGITAGNYDALGTDLMVNVPLGTNVAFRAAFGSDKHDGYLKRGYNDARNYAARARLLIEPTSNFEILSTVDYSRTKGRGSQFSYCPPLSDNPACEGVPWKPFDGLSNVVDPDTPENAFSTKNLGIYNEMNLDLDWAVVTSLTSYRRYETETTQDFGGLRNIPSHTDRFITQELRIGSPSYSSLKWVAGVFYSHEKLVGDDTYLFGSVPFVRVDVPNSIARSAAVFGEITYPVTDTLSITGGARYTYEKKESFGTATFYDGTGAIVSVVPTGGSQTQKRVTWKAGIDYRVTPHSLLYATVSTGFKSGGVNQVPSGIGLPETYDPELITAYQIGTKNRFFNDRFQLNAEAFYYDLKGFNSYVTLTHPTLPGPVFGTASSQKATLYGGEIEMTFLASDADRFDLSLALLHSRFDTFVIGSTDNSGNQIPGSPKYALGLAYQHTFDMSDGSTLVAQIDTKIVAGHYVDISNAAGSYQERYTRSGATLTYTDPGENWRASIFVRNIENKGVIQAYQAPLGPPGDLAYVYPPRVYGASVNWKLGN